MQDLVPTSGEDVTKVWERSLENYLYDQLKTSKPAMVKVSDKVADVVIRVWSDNKES